MPIMDINATAITADAWIENLLVPEDAALKQTIQSAIDADIPPISVSAAQGAMLHLFAKSFGARRILELGTLVGYSTIWLARALPADGKLISLELFERNARLARQNLESAGVADKVDIRVGLAEKSLNILINDGVEPFDFVFLDADKVSYPLYLERILMLTKPGSLIISDNVIRNGGVVDPENEDPAIRGIREFMDMLSANPNLQSTVVQTVGSKGYDGFAISRVS